MAEIDYLADEFVSCAHAWVRGARGSDGEVSSPFGRVVLGYGHQRALLGNPAVHTPGVELLERVGVCDGPLYEFFGRQLLARNGDDPRRLRRLVSPASTPKSLEPFRDEIAAVFARQSAPHLARAAPIDACAMVARFPVSTICLLFGAPDELADDLLAWVPLILSMFDPGLDDPTIDGIVISEYVEGSSNNKAIEIYNGTGGPVSLDGLQFRLYSNGRPLTDGPTSTYDFPDQDLADGAVFVVANPSYALGGTIDEISGAINFNGDDAFTIVDASGTVVDSFGQAGVRSPTGRT